MTALYLSERSWFDRLLPTLPRKASVSEPALVLRYLLQEDKFNAEYDKRHNTWKTGGYHIHLYDSLLKAVVHKDIAPNGKGQVAFTGGIMYQAETGQASKTIAAGETVWVVARYGNTLLVVDQQSDLLRRALL